MITSIFLKLHRSSFTTSRFSLDYCTEPETNKWKHFASEAWVKLIKRAALAWVGDYLFPEQSSEAFGEVLWEEEVWKAHAMSTWIALYIFKALFKGK